MKRPLLDLHVSLAIGMALINSAAAADGTWTALSSGNASGDWNIPGNWSASTIASGSGFTADFSTLDITATSTVALGAPVVIGNLIFGDTATGTAAGWVIGNGGDPANTLTLSGTTPTITVNALGTGASTAINAVVAGSSGLVKSGPGRLVLNGTNTYTGTLTDSSFGTRQFGTIVNRGRLELGSATAAGSGDILAIQGAGTAILDLNGQTISNNIALRNDTYLQNSNTSTAAVVDGTVTISSYGRIGSIGTDGLGTVVVNGAVSFGTTGTSLFINPNGGLTVLNGTNGEGVYTIQGGALRANEGVGLNSSARLNINGGVLETGSNFSRTIGSGAGQVIVGGNSTTPSAAATNGFSAFGGPVSISLNSGADLTWGSTFFLQNTSTMVLNAATANNTLTLVNALDLNGATRTFNVGASTAIASGDITNGTGTAGLTKTGAGTLSLTGTNTYNGDTTISAGTLRVNTGSLPGNVVNNAALVFDEGTSANFASTISGSGTVEKTGIGNLTLSGPNSFSGAAIVSQGTLTVGSATALGTIAGATTIASGAAIELNGQNIGGETVNISGTGVGGTGALINTSGSTAAGLRLALASDASVGGTGRIDTAFGFTVIDAGTNTLTKTGINQFTINSGTVNVGQVNVQQGILAVVNNSGGLGNTTFGTSVAGGATLVLFQNGASAMTVAENITLADGAELRSSRSQLAMTLSGNISLAGGAATVNVIAIGGDANHLTVSGEISGGGGLTKSGVGTLTLSDANSYTGATTVSDGVLVLDSTGSIASSEIGFGVQDATSGLMTIGNSGFSFAGTLNLSLGSVSVTSGAWTLFNGAEFGAGDLNLSALTSDLGSLNFVNNSGVWTGTDGNFRTWTFSEDLGQLAVIPEPGTWVLVTVGLFGLALLRRRRLS